jgi:hypothetical protein
MLTHFGSAASIAPTSQIHVSAKLLLSIVGNLKSMGFQWAQWHHNTLNFIKIRPEVLKMKHVDERTDRHALPYMHYFLVSTSHLRKWILTQSRNMSHADIFIHATNLR